MSPNHPAGRGLVCQLCAEPPHPVVRLKQPVAEGITACPYCDPHLFQPLRRSEP